MECSQIIEYSSIDDAVDALQSLLPMLEYNYAVMSQSGEWKGNSIAEERNRNYRLLKRAIDFLKSPQRIREALESHLTAEGKLEFRCDAPSSAWALMRILNQQ